VSDDLVQSVDQKFCERLHFPISELSFEFPKNLHAVFYEIITVKLGCHRFCGRWFAKMLTGSYKM
jgi:hypothetical protein